jgi:Tol biopolymer transport system component
VAYADGDPGVHVVTLATGEQKRLSIYGSHPSWSPDGKRIAFMGEDYQVWMMEPGGGRPRVLAWCAGKNYPMLVRKSGWAVTPAWSPDGRLLWFTITKTRRLRKPDPAMVQRIQESDFAEVPEEQREASRKGSLERLYWKSTHKVGIIDLEDRKVWMTDGRWHAVAWSPLREGGIGAA